MENSSFDLSLQDFHRLQNGDNKVFRRVYDEYYRLVNHIIHRSGLSGNDVDDVAQDTFVTLYQKADQIKDRSKLKAWLAVTARNRAFDRLRSIKNKKESHADEEPIPEAVADENDNLLYELQVHLVGEMVEKLARETGDESIVQFYIEGKTAKYIAEAQNVAVSTVTNRLSRFRKKFRDDFRQQIDLLEQE